MPPDAFLPAACLAASLAAMALVAVIDVRRWEIEPVSLAAAAAFGALGLALAEGLDALAGGALVAALAGGAFALAAWLRPRRIGRGDVGLMAVFGLLAGAELAPFALGCCIVSSAATGAVFSVARGKRLFRSTIPAALPAMAAAAPVLALRVGAGLAGHDLDPGPLGPPAPLAAACLAATLLLTAAGLALAGARAPAFRNVRPGTRSSRIHQSERNEAMSNRYNVTVPVKIGEGEDRTTQYRRVGVLFQNRKADGETYFSIKLDFPVGATELRAWAAKDRDAGEGGSARPASQRLAGMG